MRSKAFVLPIPNMVHAVWTSASRGRTVLAFLASEAFTDILDLLGLRDFSVMRSLFDFTFFIGLFFHDTTARRTLPQTDKAAPLLQIVLNGGGGILLHLGD
jgi:hypothetical protein